MIDHDFLARAQKQLSETGRPTLFLDGARVRRNLERVTHAASQARKKIRFATKSLRSAELLKKIDDQAALFVTGPEEAIALIGAGFRDVWIGYPLGAPQLLAPLFEQVKSNPDVCLRFTVDSPRHLEWLNEAATRAGLSSVRVVVEVDAGLSLGGLHVGAKRSPLRCVSDVAEFLKKIALFDRIQWDGYLTYESQDAGLPDNSPFYRWRNPIAQFIKRRSRNHLRAFRAELNSLSGKNTSPRWIHNGGGSGNFQAALADPSLTEITVGSGLTQPHLFDGYRERMFEAAIFYALPVSRVPAPGVATVHRGGWVASGAPGFDRLPQAVYPCGAKFFSDEGAGEIQTPLRFDAATPSVQVGDWVFFRPAKSGEIFEIFADIWWVEQNSVEKLRTYRGHGWSFLL